MNSVTLQVPISKELRTAAQKSAADMGFSSLQEAIRIFLHELAERTVDIVFRPKEIRLSPKAEKRYLRMLKDVKTVKGWHQAEDTDDLIEKNG